MKVEQVRIFDKADETAFLSVHVSNYISLTYHVYMESRKGNVVAQDYLSFNDKVGVR